MRCTFLRTALALPCGAALRCHRYVLAAYHQTQGAEQGWLIDPETMKLMLDSPAVQETFEILQVRQRRRRLLRWCLLGKTNRPWPWP